VRTFLLRVRTVEDSKKDLVELSQGKGHFVEAGVHFAEDCVGLVFSGGEAFTGVAACENFDALFNRGDGIEMELAFGYGFDYFFAEHEVVHIFRGDQHSLVSG
jgi:hypothetical protein